MRATFNTKFDGLNTRKMDFACETRRDKMRITFNTKFDGLNTRKTNFACETRHDKMRTTFNIKFDGLLLTRSVKKGYRGQGTLICHSRSQYLKTLDLEEVGDKMKKLPMLWHVRN